MTERRRPAEVFSPGEFIRDEMAARGWTLPFIHAELGNDPVRCCAFDLAAFADDCELIMDAKTAADLAMLFETSEDYWIDLDRAWRGVEPTSPAVGENAPVKEGT